MSTRQQRTASAAAAIACVSLLLGGCSNPNVAQFSPSAPQGIAAAPSLVHGRSVCATTWTNTSNFNGTMIPGGDYIWFTSVMKLNGPQPKSAVTIAQYNSKITFTANGKQYTISVPNSTVVVSPSASGASLSYKSNAWSETVPINFSGNVFLGGVAWETPVRLTNISNVTWTASYTSTNGTQFNWQWAAAVYDEFSTNYNALGVKPMDRPGAGYNNSDRAGTPENYRAHVEGGARGGGGANYTGSYSGTVGVTPCPCAPPP